MLDDDVQHRQHQVVQHAVVDVPSEQSGFEYVGVEETRERVGAKGGQRVCEVEQQLHRYDLDVCC